MGDLLIRDVDEELLAALDAAAARRGITVDAAASALLKRAVDQRTPEAGVSGVADMPARARADEAADTAALIRREHDGVRDRLPPPDAARVSRELRGQVSRPCLPDSTPGIRQDRER